MLVTSGLGLILKAPRGAVNLCPSRIGSIIQSGQGRLSRVITDDQSCLSPLDELHWTWLHPRRVPSEAIGPGYNHSISQVACRWSLPPARGGLKKY